MILGKPIGGAERLATCARVNVSLDPGRVSGVVLSSVGGAAAGAGGAGVAGGGAVKP